jgi:hypothetical protein
MWDLPLISNEFLDMEIARIDRDSKRSPVLDMCRDPRAVEIDLAVDRQLTVDECVAVLHASHPRIMEMIVSGWGSQTLHQKLSTMLYLDTEGRAGFGQVQATALVILFNEHVKTFDFDPAPLQPLEKKDTW